eukprot:scaffold202230_cov31-Tisochrysis_lutea.AAC.2
MHRSGLGAHSGTRWQPSSPWPSQRCGANVTSTSRPARRTTSGMYPPSLLPVSRAIARRLS